MKQEALAAVFQKNLLKVAGVVPFFVITVIATNYILKVLTGNYTSFENIADVALLSTITLSGISVYVIHAVYLASKNRVFDLPLKLLYQCLLFGLITFVVPTVIFEQVNTHIVCKGERGCLKQLKEWKRTHKEDKSPSSAIEVKILPVKAEVVETIDNNHFFPEFESGAPSPEQRLTIERLAADLQRAGSDQNWQGLIDQAMQLSVIHTALLMWPLMTAIEFNAPIEVIDKLLTMGAPIGNYIRLPAISFEGGAEKLSLLVERGMPLHGLDVAGNNALHTATSVALMTSVEHTNEVIKFLLENNIDPNELSQEGRSPLSYMLENMAFEERYDGAIAELIRHGAIVNDQALVVLEQLRSFFPQRYESLLRKVPELATE